jgi:hypothetical protein
MKMGNMKIYRIIPVVFCGLTLLGCPLRDKRNQELSMELDAPVEGTMSVDDNTLEEARYSDADRARWSDVGQLWDVFSSLETEDFGEPSENEGDWKEEAEALVQSGLVNLGEITSDYRLYRIATAKIEIWNDRRCALIETIPDFWGDEAAFQDSLKHYGPMELISSVDQENRYDEGQIDRIEDYQADNLFLSIYKVNGEPVKYIVLEIRITGPIGVTALDRLFTLTRDEIAYHYGESEPDEEGYYSLSSLYDDMEYLGLKYKAGMVDEILFYGYID